MVFGGSLGEGWGECRGYSRRRRYVWWRTIGVVAAACFSGGAPHVHAAPVAAVTPATPVIPAIPATTLAIAPTVDLTPAAPTAPRATQAATDHLLVITGASGSPEYAARFETIATTLLDALRGAGVPASNMTWLAEDPARTGGRAAARSSAVEVGRAITSLAARARSGDQVLIVLVGHGSHEGPQARINLPGPDITAADLARALTPLVHARVAVVNTASASGDFLPVLSARGRVVITATRTSLERNETRFGEFFARAFAGDGADTDKDGRVSLLEAFLYARTEVGRLYERERHLLTEHAMLDDDGDASGTAEPSNTADGKLAGSFVLGARVVARGGSGAPASSDPRTATILAARDSLQREVEALRARKASMSEDAYARELERLLVAIAEHTQALRTPGQSVPPAAAGRPPDASAPMHPGLARRVP